MKSRVLLTGVLALSFVVGCGCGGEKQPTKGSKPKGNPTAELKKYMNSTDPEEKGRGLAKVSLMQKDAGDLQGAMSTIGSAYDAAEQIEDPKAKATVLNAVANAQVKLDLNNEAKKSLTGVLKAVDNITEPEAKLPIMSKLAVTYFGIGNKEAAKAHLQTCEKLAEEIKAPDLQIASLLDVAVSYGKVEATGESQRLLDKCFEMARGAEDKRKQADAFSEIGSKLAALKQSDKAKAAFEEAIKSAEEIDDTDANKKWSSRGYAYATLADKQIAAGLKTTAGDNLKKAAEYSAKIKEDSSTSGPLNEKIEQLRARAEK